MSANRKTKEILICAFLAASVLLTVCKDAKADFTFGTPTNLGPTINTSVEDGGPSISPDGLEFYFYSFLDGWAIATLRVATRETTEDPWGEAVNLVPPLKASTAPNLSADGLSLYIDADLPGGSGGTDICVATRATVSDSWSSPVNLGSSVNSSRLEMGSSVSADGLELYFGSNRPGGSGDWDLWVTKRAAASDPWGTAMNLGPAINSAYFDGHPCISPDGLTLFITSTRPGGQGDWDIWMTRRATTDGDWRTPVNLGPNFNTSAGEAEPSLSADGRTLYFSDWWIPHADGFGDQDLWQVSIDPVVDLNGDYQLDIEDLVILIELWGTDESLCDIGPMPWGDGVIDAADLKVLMSYWGHELHDPSLLAHWKLDETGGDIAYDSVGENNATAMGDPTWQRESGQIDGALQFDGLDDYLAAPFILDPVKQPFSVYVWIKGGQPGQTIISQQGAFGAWLSVDATGALATGLTFPMPPVTSDTVITDDQWHRIALISDGSGMSLYLDDVEVVRTAVSPILPATGELQIGAGKNLEPGAFWSGMIDDVRIYDRVVEP